MIRTVYRAYKDTSGKPRASGDDPELISEMRAFPS